MTQQEILVYGGIISLVSSTVSGLLVGLIAFILEGRRAVLVRRREDFRTANNWPGLDSEINLRAFDLTGANLSGTVLAEADLEETNFTRGRMWDTDFSKANLRGAKFLKAQLVGTHFNSATLYRADFSGTSLRNVDFSNADLSGARLKRCKRVENCIWTSVKLDDVTELTDELRREIARQQENDKAAQSEPNSNRGVS
jgi:uncharacterized protein YjbI with pentapeptide repeats